ncbi:MAG: glutamine amidotransferase-related protein, partial [Pseudobdellovibrio sp.]
NPQYQNFDSLTVARYHSLACSIEQQNSFDIIAVANDDQKPMWLEHKNKKWLGWQFHPESFLTEKPDLLLQQVRNWCRT